MPQPKTVLFLGSADHGRTAERLFNQIAGRMGLPWRAVARDSAAVTADDLAAAAARIAFDRSGHEALFREWTGQIEFWDVPAGAESELVIERQVSALIARLLGGKADLDPPAAAPAKPEPPRKPHTVKVSRETAGRRGKGVTVVSDLPLDDAGLHELATALKQRCGTGGTAKNGRIEIQGDHRDRLATELEKLGYKVKRAGC